LTNEEAKRGTGWVEPSYFGNGLNILTPGVLQIGELACLNNYNTKEIKTDKNIE